MKNMSKLQKLIGNIIRSTPKCYKRYRTTCKKECFFPIETPKRSHEVSYRSEFSTKCCTVWRCRLSERQFVSRACRLHRNKTGKREHRGGPCAPFCPRNRDSVHVVAIHDAHEDEVFPSFPAEEGGKSIVSSESSSRSAVDRKPKNTLRIIWYGRKGKSRDGKGVAWPRYFREGRKAAKVCDTFAKDPRGLAIKQAERVSSEIFFGWNVYHTWKDNNVNWGCEISRSLTRDDWSH